MPTHSRKPRLIYSLTKLYDGRSCLVLAPSLPLPVPSMQEPSCSPSTSTLSLSSTPLPNDQPFIQSTSSSAPHRLFQPYPSHFPWSRTVTSSHRNLYLYKETRAEIIQRDKRIALRETAYNEFYARMADESRANHVGVTTRSAAAAAISSIRGENPKRSSRLRAANDSTYDMLDDVDSPPRKKARTTVRSSTNNNKSSNANTQPTRFNESSSAKVTKPAATDVPAPAPAPRLTTRSQTKSNRLRRRSLTARPPDHDLKALKSPAQRGHIEETSSAPTHNPQLQSITSQESPLENEEPASPSNEEDLHVSPSKFPASEEKTLSPELSTPSTTLGRASSTSSTLPSSRQSSDDGFRKYDQTFTDGLSLDDDTNVESGDAEPLATVNGLNTSLITKLNGLKSPQLVVSDISASAPSPTADIIAAKSFEAKGVEGSVKRLSPSLPPQMDTSEIRPARAKSPRKRSHSSDDDDDDDVSDNREPGRSTELALVIPPEVRRSGRVLKKRKLD